MEIDTSSDEEGSLNEQKPIKKKNKKQAKKKNVTNPSFTFEDEEFVSRTVHPWSFKSLRSSLGASRSTSTSHKVQMLLEKKAARNRAAGIPDPEPESEEDSENEDRVVVEKEEEPESDEDDEEEEDEDGDEEENEEGEENEENEEDGEEASGNAGAEEDDDEEDDDEEEEEEEKSPPTNGQTKVLQNGDQIRTKMPAVRDLSKLKAQVVGRPDTVEFTKLNLSRPLLRAVSDLGFTHATPIQAACIPVALTGVDILANAVTGSGKTAAFMLPILERLLYRPRRLPVTRVVVLTPTRELAAQCHSMTENLARHTNIRTCLIVGGLSNVVQESALRQNPDIVVATPGRLIDHLRNAKAVHFEDIEILVLDEADRLLEMGFVDEVKEVVRACPRGRQTMLFSATLTDQVNDLAKLSLRNPQKILVDSLYSLADNLTQEFIRIRESRERDREAIVLSLCCRTFKRRVIVFFRTKSHCHRMAILFSLAGLSVAELHGNLSQAQRLEALEKFRDAEVNFLLCTDLAARGLDIKGVEVVINYYFPPELSQYIHRVGRTARAGQKGVSVTLVSENQRKLLKEVVKRAPAGVKSRVIPAEVIAEYKEKIQNMESDVSAIFNQEHMEKEIRVAEMQISKTNNMMVHAEEIASRPRKTWFQTEQERQAAKLAGTAQNEEFAKLKKVKEAKEEEEKQSKKKKDPYAGLSRAQRRKKMMMEQTIKDLAQEHAEARLAGEEGVSADEKKKDNKSKKRVKITKDDMEAAKRTIQKQFTAQKLVSRAQKRELRRAMEEEDEENDDADEGRPGKKAKISHRYSGNKRDPDSFRARYRGTKDEDEEAKSKESNKPHRIKSSAAFKSKKRFKRRK